MFHKLLWHIMGTHWACAKSCRTSTYTYTHVLCTQNIPALIYCWLQIFIISQIFLIENDFYLCVCFSIFLERQRMYRRAYVHFCIWSTYAPYWGHKKSWNATLTTQQIISTNLKSLKLFHFVNKKTGKGSPDSLFLKSLFEIHSENSISGYSTKPKNWST